MGPGFMEEYEVKKKVERPCPTLYAGLKASTQFDFYLDSCRALQAREFHDRAEA